MKLKRYKFDIILSITVLIISAILGSFVYFKKSNNLICVIIDCNNNQTNYILKEENIDERIVDVQGLNDILRVGLSNNGVRIVESNCPHQDCVNEGKITKNGQTIVCLFNKVVIQLKNSSNEDIYL